MRFVLLLFVCCVGPLFLKVYAQGLLLVNETEQRTVSIIDSGNENFEKCVIEEDGYLKAYSPESILGYILPDGRKFLSFRLTNGFIDKYYFFSVLYEDSEKTILHLKRRGNDFFLMSKGELTELTESNYKNLLEQHVPDCAQAQAQFEQLTLTPRKLKRVFVCEKVDRSKIQYSFFSASTELYSTEAETSPILSNLLTRSGQEYGVRVQLLRKIGTSNSFFLLGGGIKKRKFDETQEVNFFVDGEIRRTSVSVVLNSLALEFPLGYRFSPQFGKFSPHFDLVLLSQYTFDAGENTVLENNAQTPVNRALSDSFQAGLSLAAGLSYAVTETLSVGTAYNYFTLGNSENAFSSKASSFELLVIIQ